MAEDESGMGTHVEDILEADEHWKRNHLGDSWEAPGNNLQACIRNHGGDSWRRHHREENMGKESGRMYHEEFEEEESR